MGNALLLVDAVINPERLGVRETQRRTIVFGIRRAALQLFVEHGFANVTVEQIAAKAEIAPRTFFNHFASKEECVLFPHQDFMEVVRSLILARPPRESPLLSIAVAYTEMFDALDSHDFIRKNLRIGASLQANEPALRAADSGLKHIWEDAVAEALVTRGVDRFAARIFAIAGTGTLKASVLEWTTKDKDMPIATALREGFATLLTGIGNVEFPSTNAHSA